MGSRLGNTSMKYIGEGDDINSGKRVDIPGFLLECRNRTEILVPNGYRNIHVDI